MSLIRILFTRPLTFLILIVFRALARIWPPGEDKPIMDSPKSIVIFSAAGIGDSLSDTPAIRAVKETYPAARIAVVAHASRKSVFEHNHWIDELIPHRKILSVRTALRLRRLKPDIAVILRANDPDIWPLAYISGAAKIVSRPESTLFRFLVNTPVSIPNWSDLPGVLQTLEIVKSIGATTADPRMNYTVTEDERIEAKRWIAEEMPTASANGQTAVRIAIQIHHSPRLAFRDWPESSFIALCLKILNDFPVILFLTGGVGDMPKAERIFRRMVAVGLAPRVVNAVGRISIRKTAALIEQCAAFITTDTGVMHIGFALNVPTLAILHPYNARRVGPYGYANLHRPLILTGPERDPDGTFRSLACVDPVDAFLAFRALYTHAGAGVGV